MTMDSLPPPVQLSASVFLYHPRPESSNNNTIRGPRLVILATWAFAHDSHISKYVDSYRELFPDAAILVMKCFMRHFFWIPTARQELVPAASVIRSILGTGTGTGTEDDSKPPALMLHVFSNSGLGTAHNLSDVYAATASVNDDSRLPLHATIFDSSPGRYEYQAVASAAMYGVPRGRVVQRFAALPFAYLLSASLWVWVHVLQGQDWVGIWARAANDPTRALETCRSYAYSDADPLVRRPLVEAHAENAKAGGFKVLRRDDFVDSAHVSHARADPMRYWRLVKETWEGRLEDSLRILST
ncbi:hypothetical protein G7Z17_g699 [Cylindrodendrum hubeiense]|uniref:Transmembrane protein 53 n=1 Tax=Cylindrodendrum hubeiense TaxID=595255 RepID=A0A9P5HKQ7_9HYPO|nr:hypothetical protein G7Z17_g699 [Cylindrodendrum hubeiense]